MRSREGGDGFGGDFLTIPGGGGFGDGPGDGCGGGFGDGFGDGVGDGSYYPADEIEAGCGDGP